MATMEEIYLEMRIRALKASRNLHQDFAHYLCGQITFEEFLKICREREAKFEADSKGGSE